MPLDDLTDEAERVLRICSACMYCDGICAVFPAIAGRHAFSLSDLSYLANLCHNCRGCWYACQYAPPHPFAVNLPKTLAQLRQRSYRDYAWPRALGRGFGANGTVVASIICAATALALAAALLHVPKYVLFAVHRGEGAFYQVIPWRIMTAAAGCALLWSIVVMTVGTVAFWRAIARAFSGEVGTGSPPENATSQEQQSEFRFNRNGIRSSASVRTTLRALYPAMIDIVTLRNLGGGGPGCNGRDERFSRGRRWFHHILIAGFAASVMSTLIAALYHHAFAAQAPYPPTSLPVAAGTVGGVLVLIGVGGLAAIERRADRTPSAADEITLNVVFLVLLTVVAASGLAVLAVRETAAMGLVLTLHIGIVVGFFLVLPVSKAVHGLYRSAALLRAAIERASPRPRSGGGE
jgi:citrate/tricarballylate utilization protein